MNDQDQATVSIDISNYLSVRVTAECIVCGETWSGNDTDAPVLAAKAAAQRELHAGGWRVAYHADLQKVGP